MLARIESVGIGGSGVAAFAAAVAFRRALPDAIVTVFTGTDADVAGTQSSGPEFVGAVSPSIHTFHRLVGLDPRLFHQRTGASRVSEARIQLARGKRFSIFPQGEIPHLDGVAVHQLWLRATADDPTSGLHWAELARRSLTDEDRAHGFGVRFDISAYLGLLREFATHLGVILVREEARADLLADRFDIAILADEGMQQTGSWDTIASLPGKLTWNEFVLRGPQSDVIESISFEDGGLAWDAGVWRLRGVPDGMAGRCLAPWQGNRLAIGRAAFRCETFDGQALATALADITRAISLLPRPGGSGREQREYNRRTGLVHGFLFDWAAERWGIDQRPLGLESLHSQFEHRGRIPFREEDPVSQGEWIGYLLGAGVRPARIDLAAMTVPETRLDALVGRQGRR